MKPAPLGEEDIRRLVPHAGEMCLLQRVVTWDEESIHCQSETHLSPGHPLRRDRALAAVHAFEYGAQAAAIHGGLRAEAAGGQAPFCYLAAIRHGRLLVARLDSSNRPLDVRAQRLFGNAGDTVYQCTIYAGDLLLAEGRVTIMQRPAGAT